jgi:hypothetical protein
MTHPESITVSLGVWRPVVGYEDLYAISDQGWVRALRTGRLLSDGQKRSGYPTVNLCKNGFSKHFLVHRLVAAAFLPNPRGLRCVNHRDSNRANPSADNLEWCSHSENNRHAYRSGSRKTNHAHMANMWKRSKLRKWNPARGVKWHKGMQRWVADIDKGGVRMHLGYFSDREDAQIVRSVACQLFNSYFNRV